MQYDGRGEAHNHKRINCDALSLLNFPMKFRFNGVYPAAEGTHPMLASVHGLPTRSVFVYLSLVLMLGCGSPPQVELQTKNGNGKPPSEDGTKKPGQPGGGKDDTTPVSKPTPLPQPPEPYYRVICGSDGGDQSLFLTSTLARSTDPNPDLRVTDKTSTEIYLMRFGGQVPLRHAGPQLSLLVEAERSMPTGTGPRKLFWVDADLSTRRGVATEIAPLAAQSAGATTLASSLRIKLNSHGASDFGNFAFVPAAKRYRVIATDTGQEIASLPLDPTRDFFPRLEEASGRVSFLRYLDRGVFGVGFLEVDLASRAFKIKREAWILEPAKGFTALPAQSWKSSGLSWVEVPPGLQPNRLTLATFDGGRIQRHVFAVDEPNAIVFPQAAVFDLPSGETRLAVAVERLRKLGTAPTGEMTVKVESAKILVLKPHDGTLREETATPYPANSIRTIEEQGLRAPTGVSYLVSSFDRKEAMVILPFGFEPVLFRVRAGGLSRLGVGTCRYPAIYKELQ